MVSGRPQATLDLKYRASKPRISLGLERLVVIALINDRQLIERHVIAESKRLYYELLDEDDLIELLLELSYTFGVKLYFDEKNEKSFTFTSSTTLKTSAQEFQDTISPFCSEFSKGGYSFQKKSVSE